MPKLFEYARKLPAWPPVNQEATLRTNCATSGAAEKPVDENGHSSCTATIFPDGAGPRATAWGLPAFTDGGWFAGRTVIVTFEVAVSSPSLPVSRSVYVPARSKVTGVTAVFGFANVT